MTHILVLHAVDEDLVKHFLKQVNNFSILVTN